MKNRYQALRKAAVLMGSLDRETAEALLAQMTPDQARAVRQAIDELDDVDASEQQAVIEEFFRIGPLMPEKSPPGIELDRPLPALAVAPFTGATGAAAGTARRTSAATARRGYESGLPASPPFRCLEEASSSALARYLGGEHPQTIAVVISHLTSDRAAEVLSLLPAQLQGEVTLRLVHLDPTDPEILDEIERGMQTWIWQQSRSARSPVAGLETLRGILAAADDNAKDTILRNLAQRDRRLASKLSHSPPRTMTFVDVERLPDAALANVLREAPAEVLLLALAGARLEFVERVTRLVPADEARLLRQGLNNFGPTRLSDVEQAQQELAGLARQFAPGISETRDEKKHLSVAV